MEFGVCQEVGGNLRVPPIAPKVEKMKDLRVPRLIRNPEVHQPFGVGQVETFSKIQESQGFEK